MKIKIKTKNQGTEIKINHCAQEFFGILSKWNTPTQKIKDEMRKGWS